MKFSWVSHLNYIINSITKRLNFCQKNWDHRIITEFQSILFLQLTSKQSQFYYTRLGFRVLLAPLPCYSDGAVQEAVSGPKKWHLSPKKVLNDYDPNCLTSTDVPSMTPTTLLVPIREHTLFPAQGTVHIWDACINVLRQPCRSLKVLLPLATPLQSHITIFRVLSVRFITFELIMISESTDSNRWCTTTLVWFVRS